METKKGNSQRTTLMMTDTERKELLSRTKKAKSRNELRSIKEQFYKEHDLVTPTLSQKWESDAKHYKE